ncbi:MAG: Mrp/NBP35 family ATP-binding protein [Bacteroidota bacterium]|nr:Mrp/NBP35 family ATP-binding protein [Bacteroidota bacterium]
MDFRKEDVLKALSHVIEPDLKKDLVTLNMIEDLKIEGEVVSFTLVLTTPACPLKESMKRACIKAIHDEISNDIVVEVTLNSRTTSGRHDNKTVLPNVKNIIGIASGKGGVGKSTVAVNLALGLVGMGAKVGLIDADIYGPSIPIMLDLVDVKPHARQEGETSLLIPVEKYGIKVLSIGFFVDPSQALVWRGPMAAGALKQLITEADWGELDYLIIDMPPGTGDIQLTLVQTLPVTGVIIVSTPQNVALADARKGISMFRNEGINVPVLGLIENMSYFTPMELPDNKYYIFGKDGCKTLAEEMQVPLLGQIPLVQSICDSGDSGKPSVLEPGTPIADAFIEIGKKLVQRVSVVNSEN